MDHLGCGMIVAETEILVQSTTSNKPSIYLKDKSRDCQPSNVFERATAFLLGKRTLRLTVLIELLYLPFSELYSQSQYFVLNGNI